MGSRMNEKFLRDELVWETSNTQNNFGQYFHPFFAHSEKPDKLANISYRPIFVTVKDCLDKEL